MRNTGRTSSMWTRAVQLAREGNRVLVCVHTKQFGTLLRNIPIDDNGTTIKELATSVSNSKWMFSEGGMIVVHVPKQPLMGYRFDVVAIDHEAQHYFTVGEWWNSIEHMLEPGAFRLD
jgi:hypothetical protein